MAFDKAKLFGFINANRTDRAPAQAAQPAMQNSYRPEVGRGVVKRVRKMSDRLGVR